MSDKSQLCGRIPWDHSCMQGKVYLWDIQVGFQVCALHENLLGLLEEMKRTFKS